MERDLGSRGKLSKVLLSLDALGVLSYAWGTCSMWVSPADVVIVLAAFEQLIESWFGHPCPVLHGAPQ